MIRPAKARLAFIALLFAAMMSGLPAAAQSPADLVTWLYTSLAAPGPAPKGLAFIAQPDQRQQFFSQRMVDFYDANDSYGDDLMSACVDFAFDIPGNDFDAAEIARTLNVTSTLGAETRTVTASFTSFGQPAGVAYDFLPVGGVWKIDDIAGAGFRVSQIPCAPKAATQADDRILGTGYCYNSGDDTLTLDVYGDGRAGFDFESWQNGHLCSANGVAQPGDGGWTFQAPDCRMTIEVMPTGGIRLNDPTFSCQGYCGAAARIDGLTFPRSAQIDCAAMPRY